MPEYLHEGKKMKPIARVTKRDLCIENHGGLACERACPHGALTRMNLIVLVCATLLSSHPAFAQFSQQGPKLVGTGVVGPYGSGQGQSVSLSADGNTAIVGGYDDNNLAGAAWVWTRSGGVWTQQGNKLVGSGVVGYASLGWSVSLSADGNTAIVGGPYDNSSAGAAWVWTRSGGVWTQQGNKLVGSGVVGYASQGWSVSLSADGNTAIVGGPYDNGIAGAAWVWTRSGGIWTQQGNKLVGSGGEGHAYAQQGESVSLSADGNTVIVGGIGDNGNVGAAWVWTRSGGVWIQQGNKLVGSGAAGPDAQQGTSVSLSSDGNTAIVGGYGDNGEVGAAWVWTRSGVVWVQQGTKLVGSGAVGWDVQQGCSVSLSADGNTAIVGGYADNNAAGAAWVFTNSAPVAIPPKITTQPVSQFIQAGSNVTFSVLVNGQSPLNYQWQFKGQNLAGQTAASLALTNVQFANAGGYSVSITNAYGSTNSAIAQLTVYTNLVLVQTNRTPPATAIGPPTIPTDATHFKVFSNGNFVTNVALNPKINTVVLTHGWNGKPADWAAYMAQIIQQRIGANTVNIVAWDWTADAQSDWQHLTAIAAKTPGEGIALGTNLVAALGVNYTQRIHFIGHSMGTLVNAAAANYVHSHGFSWTNTQMTLCDDAEIAWGIGANGLWQFTTTLPGTLVRLIQNASTTEPYWGQTLPNQFAWADNYISAVGLLHPEAANAILNFTYPAPVGDRSTFFQEFDNFHDYSHYFYEDTIEPGIFNTGGQINPTYMGFICSWEGGGAGGRPAANTYFYQDPNGLELNLVQEDSTFATAILNARLGNYWSAGVSSAEDASPFYTLAINAAQAFGQVSGIDSTAGMIVNLLTSLGGSGSHIQSLDAHPMGGPVPHGGNAGNTPAYAWISLNVPSNAVSMSFDFMLQGNGNQDSFQAALAGTNILSLETSLIQTNVAVSTGLIDVSPYAGQQVELFLGIVGGTSTNAAITASNFQFYSIPPPSLQIQLAGTNVVLTWPLSGAGYVLQSANKLAPPVSWTTVTNVPVIVNFQYTVTNQISSGSVFYRLATIASPTLQAQVSGKNFILSWPTSATGYSLETTTNLTDPNSWMTLTNVPAIVNLQNTITNPASDGARFYRLKK